MVDVVVVFPAGRSVLFRFMEHLHVVSPPGDTGQVPVTFEVHNIAPKPPTLFLRANESASEQGHRNFRLAALQTAHWYHFLFHVRWSSDRKLGFIELWLDNNNVLPKTFRRTLYPGEGVYLKQGFYRGACACTSVVYITAPRWCGRPSIGWARTSREAAGR